MRQLNTYAGIRRKAGFRALHRDMMKQRMGSPRASAFLQRKMDLPRSFDWSDHNGKNFLEPVMDQADCGSCYVASSMRMLTARHKIRQDDLMLRRGLSTSPCSARST